MHPCPTCEQPKEPGRCPHCGRPMLRSRVLGAALGRTDGEVALLPVLILWPLVPLLACVALLGADAASPDVLLVGVFACLGAQGLPLAADGALSLRHGRDRMKGGVSEGLVARFSGATKVAMGLALVGLAGFGLTAL